MVGVIAALPVADPAPRQKSRLAVIVRLAAASAERVYVTPSEAHRTVPPAVTVKAASGSGSGSGSLVDGDGSAMAGPVGSVAAGTADRVGSGDAAVAEGAVDGGGGAAGATGGMRGVGVAAGGVAGDTDPLARSGRAGGSPGRVRTTTTSTAATAAAPAAARVPRRRQAGNPSRPRPTSGGPSGRHEVPGRTVNGTAT